jgi:gluconokinase
MTAVFVVMGVSGCGKTTVGQALADELGCPFYDGDDFHPPQNVAKMAGGLPLDDDDRKPWLARLHDLMRAHLVKGETAVLACSALKKKYRQQLSAGNDGMKFIYLQGDFDLIWQRMSARENHFMGAKMLQSQFNALEVPHAAEALLIPIDQPPNKILQQIKEILDNIPQKIEKGG